MYKCSLPHLLHSAFMLSGHSCDVIHVRAPLIFLFGLAPLEPFFVVFGALTWYKCGTLLFLRGKSVYPFLSCLCLLRNLYTESLSSRVFSGVYLGFEFLMFWMIHCILPGGSLL